jgi:methylmalonyl-CoA/ethylmalonyl-CoA epimerase
MLPDAEFHHIGVACKDFDLEQAKFAALGYRQESPDVHDAVQRVHVRFLVGGGPRMELVRSDGQPGPLAPWLKSGIKLYHLAYIVQDLPAALESLKSEGGRVVVAPVPAAAFGGRHICFVMLPNLLLVELIAQ